MVEGDVESVLLKRIASAVILQALKDLRCEKKTYKYLMARNFLLATTNDWADSRSLWCELAEVDIIKLQSIAERRINAI